MGPWSHGPNGPMSPWAPPFFLQDNDPRRGEHPGLNVDFYISFVTFYVFHEQDNFSCNNISHAFTAKSEYSLPSGATFWRYLRVGI